MQPAHLAQTRRLDHLFDAELRYTTGLDPVVPARGRAGDLIGSGEGALAGPRMRGTLRWSFYAANCAYLLVKEGAQPPPGQQLCYANPGGVITTDDGAEIWFDANGYGLRGYDPAQPHLWRLTMALQFRAESDQYAWLDNQLGVWTGQFDEQTGRAFYQAFMAAGA